MLANRFRLIYMPENLSSVKEFRFSRIKTSMIIGGVTLFLFMCIAGVTALALKIIPDYKLQALELENKILLQEVASARQKIEELRTEVFSLVESDEEIRLAADLPLIDDATRQAGIGGALPSPGLDPAQELKLNLEQLELQVAIQKESYPEILQKMEENLDVAIHTPAISPVERIRLTSMFGFRNDPFTRMRKQHPGVDFGAPRGTPVFATADGVVTLAKRISTFGKVIRIDHGYGYETYYGHLQSFNVHNNQKVKRGEVIGFVGNTGRSTGPHLHYEVRIDKQAVDPMDYLFDESIAILK